MIRMKRQVRINGIQPEMMMAVMALMQASTKADIDITITSIRDGGHSAKSLHYVGFALDAGTDNQIYMNDAQKIATYLKMYLTPEFDVVTEHNHETFTHWHIEFQPKLGIGDRLKA